MLPEELRRELENDHGALLTQLDARPWTVPKASVADEAAASENVETSVSAADGTEGTEGPGNPETTEASDHSDWMSFVASLSDKAASTNGSH